MVSRAADQSLRYRGSQENYKSEQLRSGEALGCWLQVVAGRLVAPKRVRGDPGGLGHRGERSVQVMREAGEGLPLEVEIEEFER